MDYIKSLLKTIFSKTNFGVTIFIAVNIIPICLIFAYESVSYALIAFPVSLTVYFFIIISIGESIARLLLKARIRIELNERNSLSVAFSNAYMIAKQKNPIISNNIKLYVFEDVTIDSYALGRNTLCISSASLELPQQELTTLFLMKFSQFSHHDSEILAILTAGNIWYMALAIICKWYIYLFGFIVWFFLTYFGHDSEGLFLKKIFKTLSETTEKIILIFVKAICLLGLSSYKNNVYINDKFVCDCGYKQELIRFLRDFEPEQIGQKTLFGTIDSMKPDKHLRLLRIQNYPSVRQPSINAFRIIHR